MIWAYVSRCFGCVFRPRLTWLDFVAFTVGFLAPLAIWPSDEEAERSMLDAIGAEFVAGISVALLLRFICAPYLIWSELIAYISELHRELDGGVH